MSFKPGVEERMSDGWWTEMFRCLWSDPVELTAAELAWPISDTDSVLCTVEDRAVLHSLWHSALAPPWQFRL